jgi:hypothetical protein
MDKAGRFDEAESDICRAKTRERPVNNLSDLRQILVVLCRQLAPIAMFDLNVRVPGLGHSPTSGR